MTEAGDRGKGAGAGMNRGKVRLTGFCDRKMCVEREKRAQTKRKEKKKKEKKGGGCLGV